MATATSTARRQLDRLCSAFHFEASDGLIAEYLRWLGEWRDLSDDQWDALMKRAVTECNFFPTIAELDQIRRAVALEARDARQSAQQPKAGKCQLCHGEGVIAVFFELRGEAGNGGPLRWSKRLMRIFPWSSGEKLKFKHSPEAKEAGVSEYLFRCSCDAGDFGSIPSGWRKWSGGVPGER